MKIQNEFQEIELGVKTKYQKIKAYISTIPMWRWKIYGGILLLLILYLLWCWFGKSLFLKPGETITATTPGNVVNLPTVTIQPKQMRVYKDKAKVVEKLGMAPEQANNPQEHIQAAVDIPAMKHGGKEAVFFNTSTGKTRIEIKANKTPWFALEKGNAVGIAYGYSTSDGKVGKVYWNHDLARIKEVVIGTSVEGIARPDSKVSERRAEGVIWLKGEWRFDWP